MRDEIGRRTRPALMVLCGSFLLGCGGDSAVPQKPPMVVVASQPVPPPTPAADDDLVKSAEISVLWFGNSHTAFHDVPGLVGQMIRFKHPNKKYAHRYIGCGFLEDAAANPNSKKEIERLLWKFVVLQAQKISMSGRYKYSQKEGVELAKIAKAKGAQPLFFSEWGRRDVKNDGVVQESIYKEMSDAAEVRVAPVGRAWDIALAEKPSLPLHADDGNHESPVGAFLTAAVFYSLFTDSDPAELASFEYPSAPKEDRVVMANAASKVWKQERAKKSSSPKL
jgi:hypothetical protein